MTIIYIQSNRNPYPSHTPHLRTLNSDTSTPTASVPLGSQNLVVVRTKLLSILGPSIKVVLNGNGTPNTLASPHTPELLERRRSVDGRLVGAGGLEDVVGAAVRGDRALLLSSRGGVVGAVGLDDVVFDERVACPAVERDIGVYTACIPGAVVVYYAFRAGVPVLC
jgi:hypothetical protein